MEGEDDEEKESTVISELPSSTYTEGHISNSGSCHEHIKNFIETKKQKERQGKHIKQQEEHKELLTESVEEFNLNETPRREIRQTVYINEEDNSLNVTPLPNFYTQKKFNTKKRASTPTKCKSVNLEEKKESIEKKNKVIFKKNFKTKDEIKDAVIYENVFEKGENNETENRKKKLKRVQRNTAMFLNKQENQALSEKNQPNSPLKINAKQNDKKKRKITAHEKNSYLLTLNNKIKNTTLGNRKGKDHADFHSDFVNEKWKIESTNLHKLPEHVKDEYVSYLCSPLKRSERIIKTKINKMLENHSKEKEMEINENVYGNNLKDYKDVNKMACDFFPEDEERCWDEFYTQSVDKAKPFTGITTRTAVQIISQLLKPQIRKIKINNEEFNSPISENDTIMEIGHGTHPLAVEMQKQWGLVGRYIGVEFSGACSTEALKCNKLKELLIKRKVEFVKILNMNYYENNCLNGIVVESNISSKNTKTDFIKMHTFKYVFAKSTLDYITCRMDNTGNSSDWEEDLQISPTVVQMFNSLSDSLQNNVQANMTTSNKGDNNTINNSGNSNINHNKNNACIIFVEPSDPSKFRDHILTIFKVIYTATFKYNSSAKYLRLCKIINLNKASGYMIEKRNEVFQNFDDMRDETLKLISKSSYSKYADESDWFLPINEPKKWSSNHPDDIEYLVNLENNKF